MTQPVPSPVRVGFVLHVMQVAGAEMLVAEIIRRLGRRITPVVLCLDGVGQLGEVMRGEGVQVVDLRRRPGLDYALPWRMARVAEQFDLQVLHAHQYTPFFYSALTTLLLRRRVHVMFTEHGRHFPDVVSRKRRLFNELLLSRLAGEINGVSEFSVRSLGQVDGFGRRELQVIPNGIDLPRYAGGSKAEARARIGLDSGRRYITCVARFHPIKDHAMLLRGFAASVAEFADVDLLLAGDGPLRSSLTAQAEALGIARRVIFLGVREDVPEVLRAADIFALTSINEAASITLLEAMASELPVVVTAVGGNPEIVSDGVEGLLVPRGDAAALAVAFKALLSDRGEARRMGLAGRARVEKDYQLDATVEAYYRRYVAAVSEAGLALAGPVSA